MKNKFLFTQIQFLKLFFKNCIQFNVQELLLFLKKIKKKAIITDYLVIGANPFLNIYIISSILKKDINANIILLQQSEIDGWPYNNLDKKEFLQHLNKKESTQHVDIEHYINNKIISMNNKKIAILELVDNYLPYFNSNEEYLNTNFAYSLTFNEEDNIRSINTNTTVANHNRSNLYNKLILLIKFKHNIYLRKNNKQKKSIYQIFSKNIYITSPQYFLKDNYIYNNNYKTINNELSKYSFGGAKKIALTANGFLEQYYLDLNDIDNHFNSD